MINHSGRKICKEAIPFGNQRPLPPHLSPATILMAVSFYIFY